MRLSQAFTVLTLALSTVNAASVPNSNALDLLEEHAASAPRSDILAPENALEKRKGGGGRGGGGGSSSSGGGRSSGGGSSGSSGSSGRSRPSSYAGGSTRAGSGAPRTFGGGGYYGGGAAVPYQSGQRSRKGIGPSAILPLAAVALIFPGLWLYSTYPYYYNNRYNFRNETVQNATYPQGLNTTLPVLCLCQEYSVCGCDENQDQSYLNSIVGNGSYQAMNKSLVTVNDVNGTTHLVINGTLPNGTTAPGGTDDGAGVALTLGQYSGYWVMGLIVVYTAAFM